jgi:hypothetical protein
MKTTLLALATLFLVATTDAQPAASKKPIKKKNNVQISRSDEPSEMIKKTKRIIQVSEKMNNLKASGEQQKLDSILYYNETGYKGMELTDKDVFYYNEEGQNTRYDYYTQDTSGVLKDSILETYTYANGLLDEIIDYIPSIDDEDVFTEYTKMKYTYTNIGAISTAVISEWDEMSETWDVAYKTDFVYNSFNMVSTTVDSFLEGDEEYNYGKTEWYYNQDLQLLKNEYYSDIEMDGIMVMNFMIEYAYENGVLKSETSSELNNDGKMQYSDRYNFSYNDDGVMISELDEIYDAESDEWIIDEKTETTYRSDLQFENTIFPVFFFGNYTSVEYSLGVFDEVYSYDYDEDWYLYYTENYYYSELGTGVTEQASNKTWSVYPNPANDQLYVNSNEVLDANCILFDASGRVILDQKVIAGQTIDLSLVKAGCYILQISNNTNHLQTIKVIKQ